MCSWIRFDLMCCRFVLPFRSILVTRDRDRDRVGKASGREEKQGVKQVFRDRSSTIQGIVIQRLFLPLSFLLSLLSLGSEGSA